MSLLFPLSAVRIPFYCGQQASSGGQKGSDAANKEIEL
jgi:hypothetical protein